MKSPKDMRIIQIDITNACPHRCSNCTRFCGHHEKSFFMDFDTFKRAVDSLEGYVGTVGIMGGEPTMHPEFERFARYLDSKMPKEYKKKENHLIYPQNRFMEALHDQEFENTFGHANDSGEKRMTVYGAGLWSAMGNTYKRHYEVIQDVFSYQAVNDHTNAMYHQPILISRKDLGITDEEWYELRDHCWINDLWSASITPKGAFFCEVAAALDMLFDGPGGWPIEPGWWKREPKDFGDQLQWCEICGLALNTFTRDANEEIDDMSQTLYEKLSKMKSPKMKQGKYNVVKVENGQITEETRAHAKQQEGGLRYTDSYEARFSATDTVLYPDGFVGVLVCNEEDTMESIKKCVNYNKNQFVRYFLIPSKELKSDSLIEAFGKEEGIEIIKEQIFGKALNSIMKQCKDGEYLLAHTSNIELSVDFAKRLKKYIINPGTMHYMNFMENTCQENGYINNASQLNKGYAALFNRCALSLRELGFDRIAQVESVEGLVANWQKEKVIELSDAMNYEFPEIALSADTRYILYGTGDRGKITLNRMKQMGMEPVLVVDSDESKWGTQVAGYVIENPEKIMEYSGKFDRVIISSIYYYGQIKERLQEMGLKPNQLSMGD